jgi:large subunit ribosomal protein L9
MDIILLEHIEELGTVGQVVKVKAGYARNYLFPRKLACPATDQNQRFYRTLIEAKQKKLAKEKASAETQAAQLSAVTLTFVRKSRDQESRLFGSVTNTDVSQALKEKGLEFDRRRISISEPVKKFGEYKAQIRLHPEVQATINLIVKPEGETENAG